ncbi:MAG: VOC family protein [Deltaproteobacteria bacterium]|nr:MAG: VOC family protein [Deltaproteobacteria bacterium]
MRAKFVHTNLIAEDWRRLADFYEQVFGCTPVPPERNLSGPWLEKGTSVPEVEIWGVHLRLPGYDSRGPTLEIFQYNHLKGRPVPAVNRPGFAHIGFVVDDVAAARDMVTEAGGRVVGELVSAEIPGAGKITFVYVADPEGNIIELQKWED